MPDMTGDWGRAMEEQDERERIARGPLTLTEHQEKIKVRVLKDSGISEEDLKNAGYEIKDYFGTAIVNDKNTVLGYLCPGDYTCEGIIVVEYNRNNSEQMISASKLSRFLDSKHVKYEEKPPKKQILNELRNKRKELSDLINSFTI